jgi:hypothetical protein
MGLDTAVFESQDRRLPWHGNESISTQPSWIPHRLQHQHTAARRPRAPAPRAFKSAVRAAKERAAMLRQQLDNPQHPQVPNSWALDRHPVHAVRSKVTAGSSSSRVSGVRPHWLSHMQQDVPASLRDEAVRLHWQGAAVQPRRG